MLRDNRHLPGFEEDHPASVFQDGRDIRGNIVFILAETYDHATRITDARAYDFIGFISREEHDTVGALDLIEGSASGFGQVETAGMIMFNQVNQ